MLIDFFVNGIYKDEALLAVSGIFALFAGLLNGLIGTGGGVIMLLILYKIYKNDAGAAHAAVTAVTLPMTVLSAALYLYREPAIISAAFPFLPAAAAGGAAGAALLGRAKPKTVSLVFTVMTLAAGTVAVLR